MVPIAYDEFSPMPGLPVMAGDKQVGMLGTTAKGRGLALLRLDRVADALADGTPLIAGGIAIHAGEAGLGEVSLAGREGRVMSAARADDLVRCPWPGNDPLYVAYHDEEWGVPEYDDRALFEKLILDGFQAGLAWITILRKRENFRKAFDDFNPEKIARYTPKKVERLMQDAGIVRNRAKIEGAVGSARAWLKIMEERPGLFASAVGPSRRQAAAEQFPPPRADPGGDRAVEDNLQGSRRPRLQVRRPDHRLCLHAGGRHGQRSSHDLPSPRRRGKTRQAQMSKTPGRKTAPRAWQRMLSGRRLDLLDPSPLDVEIEDIAHGLARVARWNGQTKGAHIYSVAQHSLLVEALARAKVPRLDAKGRLAVLLHDAPEYVIGDMISPFKAVIGDSYKAVEHRLLAAIHRRFGLPSPLPATLQA